jgi:hypothetical protein
LAIGNGTAGDFSGSLKLTALTFANGTIDSSGNIVTSGNLESTGGSVLFDTVVENYANGSRMSMPADGTVLFRNNANTGWNIIQLFTDTGISRLAGGSLAIGNGTAGDKTGALSLSRINAFSADLAGSVTSSPTGIVASKVVVAVGGTTGTFTVTSTEGFTIGDTVTLSAGGWTGGSGLASTTCTVTTITGGVTLLLTYVSGGPWVAGTYTAQTGTLLQTGVTSVTVTYVVAYTNTPFVTVTPTSNCGAWYVSAQSTAGFTITYATSGTMTFNYHVIGNQS